MNGRVPDRILDLIHHFEASVGASHKLAVRGGRQSNDVIGEVYLVR